jgi:hypothetical protein
MKRQTGTNRTPAEAGAGLSPEGLGFGTTTCKLNKLKGLNIPGALYKYKREEERFRQKPEECGRSRSVAEKLNY